MHVNKQTSQSTCTYLHLGKHLIIFMTICLYKMYDMHGYTKLNHYNGHGIIVNNVNYGSYCPHVCKCTLAIPSPLSATKTICTSITVWVKCSWVFCLRRVLLLILLIVLTDSEIKTCSRELLLTLDGVLFFSKILNTTSG